MTLIRRQPATEIARDGKKLEQKLYVLGGPFVNLCTVFSCRCCAWRERTALGSFTRSAPVLEPRANPFGLTPNEDPQCLPPPPPWQPPPRQPPAPSRCRGHSTTAWPTPSGRSPWTRWNRRNPATPGCR